MLELLNNFIIYLCFFCLLVFLTACSWRNREAYNRSVTVPVMYRDVEDLMRGEAEWI